jgi:hypothetical protein
MLSELSGPPQSLLSPPSMIMIIRYKSIFINVLIFSEVSETVVPHFRLAHLDGLSTIVFKERQTAYL